MIIDTDISCVSADGILGKISCNTPKELLEVMKSEKVSSCKISVSSMGQSLIDTSVSLSDVKKWISMNNEKVVM